MGFEIDKPAEEVQQKGTQFISNEQAAEEQNSSAAPLTDAENQDLTYTLSGEAQSTGFSEQDAESLTETLSGKKSVMGDSASFEKNKINIPLSEDIYGIEQNENEQKYTIPSTIQFFINKYPNITKAYLKEGKITFASKDNTVITDENGIPLSIDLSSANNSLQINFLALFFEQNNREISTNSLLLLSALQEKVNNQEEVNKFYQTLLTENEFLQFQAMGNEEQKSFITEKLITMFAKNELQEKVKEYLFSDKSNNTEDKTDSNLPTQVLGSMDFRIKISEAETLEELDVFRKQIENMPFTNAEKQMLYNECLKQQGKIQSISDRNNFAKITDSAIQNNDFDEQRIKSSTAFALFNMCRTPIQREMANIILSDTRLYLTQDNLIPIFNVLLENCKTQEDISIKKTLIEKALQIPTLIENGVLKPSVMVSINNANSETFNLQLTILDLYCQQSDGDTSDENNKLGKSLHELSEFVFQCDKPELTEFSKMILFDEELKHNETALETLLIVLRSNNINKDALGIIHSILKTDTNTNSAEDIVNASNEFINNEETTANFIKNCINNDFKVKKYNNKEEEILYTLITSNAKIYEDFVDGRECTNKNLYELFKHSHYSYEKNILSQVCKHKQYSADNIIDILKYTSEKTADFTKQVMGKRNLTINEKINILFTINNNNSQTDLINLFLSKKDINLNLLPKFLNSMKTLQQYKVIKNNDINPDRINDYVELLQNPKSAPWVNELLNQGWDIETIFQLNHTRLRYYAGKDNSITDSENPQKQIFISYGLKNEEAEKIVEAINKSGVTDTEMQQVAIDLLNSGIPKHNVGDIIIDASYGGKYNSQISADAITVRTVGLNEFLERYLPIANNLSSEELVKKFDYDIRTQLITMIYDIPQSKKSALRAKGFNIDGILEKLKLKKEEDNNTDRTEFNKNKPHFHLIQSELKKLEKSKNYKAIFEKMGIDVKVLSDGTLQISHYSPYIDGLTLSEYGIKENELLANVSIIKGNANFNDSEATALPNLKIVGGEMSFGTTDITDLHNLEEINKKKIFWELS